MIKTNKLLICKGVVSVCFTKIDGDIVDYKKLASKIIENLQTFQNKIYLDERDKKLSNKKEVNEDEEVVNFSHRDSKKDETK